MIQQDIINKLAEAFAATEMTANKFSDVTNAEFQHKLGRLPTSFSDVITVSTNLRTDTTP